MTVGAGEPGEPCRAFPDLDALLTGPVPATGPTVSEGDPVTGEWTRTRGEGFVIAPLLVGKPLTAVYAPEWNTAEEAAEAQLTALIGALDRRFGTHREVAMRVPLFRRIAGDPMPALFQALCDEDLLGDLTVWGPLPNGPETTARWLAVSLNQSDAEAPMILCAAVTDRPITELREHGSPG